MELGRFTTPEIDGKPLPGMIYLAEVTDFAERKGGRPRLTDEQRQARLNRFKVGDTVTWSVEDAIGTVEKVNAYRLKLAFSVDGKTTTKWVNTSACKIVDPLASDNEVAVTI